MWTTRGIGSISLLLISTAAVTAYEGRDESGAHFNLVAEWGEYGSKAGQFKYPCMLAVDASSSVYVVDQHNHRIQKFDAGGRFLHSWGRFGNGPGQFNYPFGIALDSSGAVYVSDMDNHRVQKFSPGGEFLKAAGGYGSESGRFKHPYGLAIDSRGIVYVIDTLNYRVQKFDRDLNFVGAWGSQEEIGIKTYMPHEIAIARDGSVILSDRQNHRISIFNPVGKLVKRFGQYGEGPDTLGGRFSEPHGVAVGPDGTIYVCDRYNYRVQRFNPAGVFEAAWSIRGPKEDSQQYVLGLAADAKGNIYVTDQYRHRVLKYRYSPSAPAATGFGAPGRVRK
ncbi:MAG: NHL repeat-containing protein [Acidobacteria bacterium]|nr:NHL repeat-containing protein [Acidobacteriota bacterium]